MSKFCYCETCRKSFHSLGIARHRAMHRDRKEDCEITYSDGKTWAYPFGTNEAIKKFFKSLTQCEVSLK